MIRVAIIGASGYTGTELLRLCAQHPEFEVVLATGEAHAGTAVADLYPALAGRYPDLVYSGTDPDRLDGVDLAFLGLPHEASLEVVPRLAGRVGCIVDLSAAFRLKDAAAYPVWYGFSHDRPDLLASAVYGLPEFHRAALAGASLVATPGCHVTAATLALAPLVREGLVATSGVIVDSITGVSGAGRVPTPTTHFCTVDESVVAYGLLDHRHTPEIEQEVGAQVLFTPHLAPMNRGILATCYGEPVGDIDTTDVLAALRDTYAREPFVTVLDGSPATKSTLGSNAAHLTARVDRRTGTVVSICAIDNLAKGAAGGAVQAANVALGLPETSGLSAVGMFP